MAKTSRSTDSFKEEILDILYELNLGSDKYYEDVVITRSKEDSQKLSLSERFGGLPVFRVPQQLVYTNKDNKLVLNDQVIDQISTLEVPLNIVAICGLYRSGKSYLMNRLANERTGFTLGKTVASHTKGIWAWCRQHPRHEEQILLLLDTEGLADPQKADEAHDTRLFSLAVLLSSTLIYNNSGVFNNDSLEKLSFVTKLTETVRVDGTMTTEDNADLMRILTPTFVMCLRDFYLELEDGDVVYENADEYFEAVLEKSDIPGKEKANVTRECIRDFFPSRKCFTIAQPTVGRQLARIETVSDQLLMPEFIEDVDQLRNFVYDCPPKVLDAVTKTLADGRVFEAYAHTYVRALAEDDTMTFVSAYEQASGFQNSKLVVEVSHQYRQELEKIQLPVPQKVDLQRNCLELQKQMLREFRKRRYPYKVEYFEDKVRVKMEAIQKEKMDENVHHVQMHLTSILHDLHEEMVKRFEEKYNKKFGLTFYKQDLEDLEMRYRKKASRYDEDELQAAFLTYKKSIKEEKLKVEYMAKIREEEERNERLREEVALTLAANLQEQFEKMKEAKEKDFQEELEKLKANFTESMGYETIRKKPFWKKFKLLFSG